MDGDPFATRYKLRACRASLLSLLGLTDFALLISSNKIPHEEELEDVTHSGGGNDPTPGGGEDDAWKHCVGGEVVEGRPQWRSGVKRKAYFKNKKPLRGGDVWRMRLDNFVYAVVGFAGEEYEPASHSMVHASHLCELFLFDGKTVIHSGISLNGEDHVHHGHVKIPKSAPCDLALRCDPDGNVPQVQFDEDGVWHDFAPEGRTALKAGPWFPYLMLNEEDRLSDHRVSCPKPTKSAGNKAPVTSQVCVPRSLKVEPCSLSLSLSRLSF